MAEVNGLIFNIYDILQSKVGDTNHNNSVTHQLGNINTTASNKIGDVYSDGAQVWAIIGVSSMPAAPNGNTDCAQSISISTSDYDMMLGTRDTRFQSFISDLAAGDLYLYATGSGVGAGIKIKAATNQVLIGNVTGSPQTLTFSNWSQDLLQNLQYFFQQASIDPGLAMFASGTAAAAVLVNTALGNAVSTTPLPTLATVDTKAT